MKKAFALILALIMCLSVGMMAFAEYTADDAVVDSEVTELETAGDASTNVDILVNSTNISVTVPLRYAVVADVKGGECLVPTDGTYYIQNNSAIDVDVTAAVVENGENNSEWELVSTVAAGVPAGKNQIAMTLTPDAGTVWDLSGDYTADWTVDAATTEGEGVLDIAIDATSSMLNTTEDEIDAFIITYTFAAA